MPLSETNAEMIICGRERAANTQAVARQDIVMNTMISQSLPGEKRRQGKEYKQERKL